MARRQRKGEPSNPPVVAPSTTVCRQALPAIRENTHVTFRRRSRVPTGYPHALVHSRHPPWPDLRKRPRPPAAGARSWRPWRRHVTSVWWASLPAAAPGPGDPAGRRTTRATGLVGVTSGRNQRNQMRPRAWPAVEIQLGCPGSPTRHHQLPRAVVLVDGLIAVEGHALVGVVVGVEELVPQTDVPERAVRRTAFDHQGLVLAQFVGAHGVGGVARGPPEGLARHPVGLVDGVGCPERRSGRCSPGRATTSSAARSGGRDRRRPRAGWAAGRAASMCHCARRPCTGSAR